MKVLLDRQVQSSYRGNPGHIRRGVWKAQSLLENHLPGPEWLGHRWSENSKHKQNGVGGTGFKKKKNRLPLDYMNL